MASSKVGEENFIEIDGSYLEGGGQILRISTALSVLLNKPIKVIKIRAGRKDGGLKPQHLTGIKLLAEISKAKCVGDKLSSTELTFIPSGLRPGRYSADTKTAGSICLIMQNSIPCLIFAKEECELDLRGGTNADNAPQIDYFDFVFNPISAKFGLKNEVNVLKRGYYPKGGGEVYVKTQPLTHLNPIDMTDFGRLTRIYGRAFVAGFLPVKIAQTMATTATRKLTELYKGIPIDIQVIKEPEYSHVGAGTGILIVAETSTGCLLCGSALGKKGLPAENVAMEAVDFLVKDLSHEACVDEYLQDQLIIFMALAKGKSRIKSGPLSLHTKTAIHFTELLTGVKFNISQFDGREQSFLIECEGIGYEPR